MRVALVTGGSRGIGAGIVKRLAADGFAVAFTYAQSEEAANAVAEAVLKTGRIAMPIQADNRDMAELDAVPGKVVKELGRLDILINNAGCARVAPLTEFTDEQFDEVFQVNVRGLFAITRAAVRVMEERGRIINIGSINGDTCPAPGGAVYAASKAAVQMLTKGWATEFGDRQITVNCVQPGPIDTDMNPADSERGKEVAGRVPLKRYGEPDEVAALVAFLCRRDSSYVNAAILNVDGGITA